MIIKNYETNKIDLKKFKYFLLYGNNKGHIDEIIKNNFVNKLKCNLYNYDESEIINDKNWGFITGELSPPHSLIKDYGSLQKIFLSRNFYLMIDIDENQLKKLSRINVRKITNE